MLHPSIKIPNNNPAMKKNLYAIEKKQKHAGIPQVLQ